MGSVFGRAAEPFGKLSRQHHPEQDAESSLGSRGAVKCFCSHDPGNASLLTQGARVVSTTSRLQNSCVVVKISFVISWLKMWGWPCLFSSTPSLCLCLCFFYCLDNMDMVHFVEIFWTWVLPPYLESVEVIWSRRWRPAVPFAAFTIYISVLKNV